MPKEYEILKQAALDLLNSTDFQVEDTSHLDETTLQAAKHLKALIEGKL